MKKLIVMCCLGWIVFSTLNVSEFEDYLNAHYDGSEGNRIFSTYVGSGAIQYTLIWWK